MSRPVLPWFAFTIPSKHHLNHLRYFSTILQNILNEMLFQILLRLESDSAEVGLEIAMINVEANEEVLGLKKSQGLLG